MPSVMFAPIAYTSAVSGTLPAAAVAGPVVVLVTFCTSRANVPVKDEALSAAVPAKVAP